VTVNDESFDVSIFGHGHQRGIGEASKQREIGIAEEAGRLQPSSSGPDFDNIVTDYSGFFFRTG
jgi:hypothetical protein